MPSINISLSPELELMIHDRVESGEYRDASEVVSEALRAMVLHDERVRIMALRDAAISEGIAAADRGAKVELTRKVWDQIMAEADAVSKDEPLDPLITGEF